MIDKKLEDNIKRTHKFLEFWSKFHELYRDAVSERALTGYKGEMFISTRTLVNSRFDDLIESLEIGSREKVTRCFPVYEILSVDDLSAISDEKLNRLEDCWTDSYIFLSSLLSRFKKKKQRIEKFNKFLYITKRLIVRGGKK